MAATADGVIRTRRQLAALTKHELELEEKLIPVPEELFLSRGFDSDLFAEESRNGSVVPERCSCAWLQCIRCGRWVVAPIVSVPANSLRALSDTQKKGASALALPNPRTFCCDWEYCDDDLVEYQRFTDDFLKGLREAKENGVEFDAPNRLDDTVFVPLRQSARKGAESRNEREEGSSAKRRRTEGTRSSKEQEVNFVMCFCCHKLRKCRRPFPGCDSWVCALGPDSSTASCSAPQAPTTPGDTTTADLLARLRRSMRHGIGARDPRAVAVKQMETLRKELSASANETSPPRPQVKLEEDEEKEEVKGGLAESNKAVSSEKKRKSKKADAPSAAMNAPPQTKHEHTDELQHVKEETTSKDINKKPDEGNNKDSLSRQPRRAKHASTKSELETDSTPAAVQSSKQQILKWAECDECGKWRIVSPAALRSIVKLSSWKCGMVGNKATCADPSDDARFGDDGALLPPDYLP